MEQQQEHRQPCPITAAMEQGLAASPDQNQQQKCQPLHPLCLLAPSTLSARALPSPENSPAHPEELSSLKTSLP